MAILDPTKPQRPDPLVEPPELTPAPSELEPGPQLAAGAQVLRGLLKRRKVQEPTPTIEPEAEIPTGVEEGKYRERAIPEPGRTDLRNYNMEQMDTTENVEKLIDELAEQRTLREGLKYQGVEETAELAKGYDFESLTGTAVARTSDGQPVYSAQQIHAATEIMLELGDRVDRLAEYIRNNKDSGAVSAQQEMQLLTWSNQIVAIEKHVSGAANEAGRALQILQSKKRARGYGQSMEQYRKILGDWGDDGAIRYAELLGEIDKAAVDPRSIAELAERHGITPGEAESLLRLRSKMDAADKASAPSGRDMFAELWRNSLFSLKSHARNITSNISVAMVVDPLERTLAGASGAVRERYARMRGGSISERAYSGEGAAQMVGFTHGLMEFFSDLANNWRKADRIGVSTKFDGYSGQAINASGLRALGDANRQDINAVSRGAGNAYKKIAPEGSMIGNSMDAVVDFYGQWIVRPHQRLLSKTDEVFKSGNYHGELAAQAYRTAKSEGLSGADFVTRYDELLRNPTNDMFQAASERAELNTFTNQQSDGLIGSVAKSASKLAKDHPSFRVVFPFINTPANILRYTLVRSPLAPLTRQWRDDWMAGGVRRDKANGQYMLGSGAALAVYGLWANGNITGSGGHNYNLQARQRAAGVPPRSIIVGDTAFAYSGIDPMGMLFDILATTAESVAYSDSDDSAFTIATNTALSAGTALMNKTYMEGFSRLITAANSGNEDAMARELINLGVNFSMMWMGSGAGPSRTYQGATLYKNPDGSYQFTPTEEQSARWRELGMPEDEEIRPIGGGRIAIDSWLNVAQTYQLRYRKQMPFFSEGDVPPRIDAWGDPSFRYGGLAYTMASPTYHEYVGAPQPRDEALYANEVAMPAARCSFRYQGVAVNLADFDAPGHAAADHPGWACADFEKHVGKRRRTAVDAFVEATDRAMDGPDSANAMALRNIVTRATQLAKNEFMLSEPYRKQWEFRVEEAIPELEGGNPVEIPPVLKRAKERKAERAEEAEPVTPEFHP